MLNQAVLVTGTSRGIGRATALRLASAGMSVIAGVRDRGDGARLEAEARGRLTSIALDIGEEESISAAAQAVRAIVGERGLFGLVNNAAAAGRAVALAYVTEADLEATFRVTAFGTVLTTRALLPMLERARGRIVNVGAGPLPLPFLGTTFGAKSAMEAMSDVLRVELQRTGVSISIVQPGMTRWEDPDVQLATYDKALEDGIAAVPVDERSGYEREVARFKALNRRMLERAASADSVAATIEKALTAHRPRARYSCGADQKAAALLDRFTSARIRDAVVRRMTRL